MESKWGLVPDMSASVTLRELVPIDVAKELTMTHRIFKGQEAKDLGIVTRVCDDAMADALALAKEIASKSPDAVAAAKRLYNNTYALNDRQVSLSLSLYTYSIFRVYTYSISLYIYMYSIA
jgi:enoyl-CoA hydratase/carnithine racemase